MLHKPKAKDAQLCYRWLIRRDVPDLYRMHHSASESFDAFEQIIRRFMSDRSNIGIVCELNKEIVGYMIYELNTHRFHLWVLVVHREYRRASIGSAMLDKLKAKLSYRRRRSIGALIHEYDLDAQLFLRANGFFGLPLPSYYVDGSDAVMFEFYHQGEA